MSTLRIILWDQLSMKVASLQHIDKKNDYILLCETREECTYVKHHKKKLVFLLSAMRHFAKELQKSGYQVHYVKLDDKANTQTLAGEISRFVKKLSATKLVVTWPGEYRIYDVFLKLQDYLPIEVYIQDDDRFLANAAQFAAWAKHKKTLRMEFFYREMRKKYNILMHNGYPEGGKWNYDSENRHFPKNKIAIPLPYQAPLDNLTSGVIALVESSFPDHFGDIQPFHYAVTRGKALQALKQFINERLAYFGDYQDVMLEGEAWLFHAHISLYINVGLLSPMECIKAVEVAYYHQQVNLAAAEGFIRQILGWREFIRGIYWLKMPAYKSNNFLNAKRLLPGFFWSGETNMNCLKQCVSETKAHAYAHHIQRLMVLGNFALLAGIHPDQVNEWYLIVYADAHEWVELPNVTGMILFADGGYLASKPYAAGGAYINKMSNYCKNCVYQVKQKNGAAACPFNYLYWNFLVEHHHQLKNNQRLAMVYAALARMSEQQISQIRADAKTFLDSL